MCPVLTPITFGEVASRSFQLCSVPAGRGRVDEPDGLADEGLVHRHARELRHVGRTRVVAGRVEAVRIGEVRVGEPELARAGVHQLDEAADRTAADEGGDRVGGVVRALDQRGADQVAQGHALAGSEVDRRLADRSGALGDRGDVVERGVLERDDRGHQLRDRRHRQVLALVVGGQDLAGAGVLDDVCVRVDGRRRCGGDDCEEERRGDRGEESEPLHGARTLLDADSLTDRQRDRIDVGVEHEQLLDGRVVLVGDDGERVAGPDHVELRSRLVRRRPAGRAGLRGRRGGVVAAVVAGGVVVSPFSRPERTSRIATVAAARKASGAAYRASRALPPHHQPETDQTSARSRAASAPAAPRQSSVLPR